MKAYKHLIKHAINDKGYTVSIWDGEDWQVKRSTKENDIYAAIDSVDESQIRFRDMHGKVMGWALVIDYENEPECSIADHSDNEWINQWFDLYESTI
jgi:hypothetical protein